MQQCIQICTDCHHTCLNTVITHRLHQGEHHPHSEHIRLMLDCAEICQTSANFMLRGSNLHSQICAVCAEICDRCATHCARFPDAQMQACAEICRRCAQSCRQMSMATP